MSFHRLRKCNADEINTLVKSIDYYSKFYTKNDIDNLINHTVNTKTTEVINIYDIDDCIDIIKSNGDIHDAFMKSQETTFDMNDKLKFHQQLARPYVREIIFNKVNEKIFINQTKRNNEEKSCSICFGEIASVSLYLTKCFHTYHKKCIAKWDKKTCPMCRCNI